MATSLLYLDPYLGPYFILGTVGSGGVYIYSCFSYYSYYRVAEAAIGVTSGTVIGTTYSVVVGIANRISRAAGGISRAFYRASCGA